MNADYTIKLMARNQLVIYLPHEGTASRIDLEEYVTRVIEQHTTPNEDTTAERLARGLVHSILHRLGVRDGSWQTWDEWRRICLSAFENLERDTQVTIRQIDEVLTLGAQRHSALDASTEAGMNAIEALDDEVASKVGLDPLEVDAILTVCADEAAELLPDAPVG